jgi:hypothetical protein
MAYTGIFPNEVSIFIQAAGTNGSALTAADKIVGEITNWKVSGGAISKDLVNVFGGQLDIRKPREMVEVSFDVYSTNVATSALSRWATYKGLDGTSATLPPQKVVFISGISGGNWMTYAVNYADVTVSDVEQAADDAIKQTITFKVVPLSTLGVANLKSSALAYSATYFNW